MTPGVLDELGRVREAPADGGVLALIVSRPAPDERALLDAAELRVDDGLVGDGWRHRGSRHTADGTAELDRQLTLMNARAVALIAGGDDRARWALAGDQLYVDLDISTDNLPPGTRLRIGSAVVEITAVPHTGCGKFAARFGQDAVRLVNSPEGRHLNLRGVNARIVVPGTIRVGDVVEKA